MQPGLDLEDYFYIFGKNKEEINLKRKKVKNRWPPISIIAVNHNGRAFILKCLETVLGTNYPNFEVIVVDNASTDGSVEKIRKIFGKNPKLKLFLNNKNEGPSRARNAGAKRTKGKYLIFLDGDTEVTKDSFKHLIHALETDPTIGAAQAKLLLKKNNRIDSCGHFLTFFGFPYEVGVGETDRGQYDNLVEIFGAKSAAMIVRRDAFRKCEGFDTDYFIYGEETDLCWRIWLAGYRIVLVPSALVYHHLGGTLSKQSRYRVVYEGAKNGTKNLIKNLEPWNLVKILPLYILSWLVVFINFFLKGRFSEGIWVLRGLVWNIGHLRSTLKDRNEVQSKRKIDDKQLVSIAIPRHNLGFYLKKAGMWLGKL